MDNERSRSEELIPFDIKSLPRISGGPSAETQTIHANVDPNN